MCSNKRIIRPDLADLPLDTICDAIRTMPIGEVGIPTHSAFLFVQLVHSHCCIPTCNRRCLGHWSKSGLNQQFSVSTTIKSKQQ